MVVVAATKEQPARHWQLEVGSMRIVADRCLQVERQHGERVRITTIIRGENKGRLTTVLKPQQLRADIPMRASPAWIQFLR